MRRPHTLLVDSDGRDRRSLGEYGHDYRQRVRPPGIFNKSTLELAAARTPLVPVTIRLPWSNLAVALSSYAVLPSAFTCVTAKGDAIRPELAIDKSQRGGIRAIRAINASDLISANRELIGMRFTLIRPPAAAVIIGILGSGRVGESPRRKKQYEMPFSDHKFRHPLFENSVSVFHANPKRP